jgi:hypothetical protein
MNMPLTSRAEVTPSSPDLIINPEMGEEIIRSFQSLFHSADLISKIEAYIASMENWINKMLLQWALLRVKNMASAAEEVSKNTQKRLKMLRVNITDSQATPQA